MNRSLWLILNSQFRPKFCEKPQELYISHKIEFELHWCHDLHFELLTKTHNLLRKWSLISTHTFHQINCHNKKRNFVLTWYLCFALNINYISLQSFRFLKRVNLRLSLFVTLALVQNHPACLLGFWVCV